MHLFLTSSPSGCPFDPGPPVPVLDEANGFVPLLRSVWPATAPKALFIAADPYNAAGNDQMRDAFCACFANAGLPFAAAAVCDGRNGWQLPELLAQSGFVMLAGGHVPTQNRFLQQIGAAHALRQYDGIVVSVSAGTMNCAGTVYAQPEEPGEAADPHFNRWLTGLGLTGQNILPHFQKTRHWTLDGQRLLEDIALPDSRTRPLLALPDGSFVYRREGREVLYGPAWLLTDGTLQPLGGEGQATVL